jgi:hypothetical protein
MPPQTAEAIATWAEHQGSNLHKGQGSRLSNAQRAAILKLARLNKSQVEIAQAIGCNQGTVSRWLSDCEDSTEQASTYLRGSALRMAENIVKRGAARDHIQALNGLGVLQGTESRTLNVIINGVALHGVGQDQTVEGEILSPQLLTEAGESQSDT